MRDGGCSGHCKLSTMSETQSMRKKTARNEMGQKAERDQAINGYICLANTFGFYVEILGKPQKDF